MTKHKASAVRFFYSHAGYSYNPKVETRSQGRWRCARKMAEAERYARANGWQYRWEDDWSVGNHGKFYGEGSAYDEGEPSTCEQCDLLDADGGFLASLGCIDDASNEYRRVIEAELALEAMGEVKATLDRDASSAGDVPMAEVKR